MYSALILAAGAGTRMKSDIPKVVHEVLFKPIIGWVLDAVDEVETKVVVIGHGGDKVKEVVGDKAGVKFAVQEQQLGTGHAVSVSKECFNGISGSVVILGGDAPLITKETLNNAYAYHKKAENTVTVLTAHVDNPTGYGRMVRNFSGNITKIVEHKEANADELNITEINSGMYFFEIDELFAALEKIGNKNAQGEYYLTDTIEIMLKENKKVGAYLVSDNTELLGINDRRQLAHATEILRSRIINRHLEGGVSFVAPSTAFIGGEVDIAPNVTIMPNVIIKGNTTVGGGCVVGSNSQISNSRIGTGVKISCSVIEDSEIGENASVGPFAYMHPENK